MGPTNHARENLEKLSLEIGPKATQALIDKVSKAGRVANGKYRESTAVVVYLEKPVSRENGHRDFWAESDVVAAIIRNGKVTTVMLTRKSQVTKDHFRTDFIFS